MITKSVALFASPTCYLLQYRDIWSRCVFSEYLELPTVGILDHTNVHVCTKFHSS